MGNIEDQGKSIFEFTEAVKTASVLGEKCTDVITVSDNGTLEYSKKVTINPLPVETCIPVPIQKIKTILEKTKMLNKYKIPFEDGLLAFSTLLLGSYFSTIASQPVIENYFMYVFFYRIDLIVGVILLFGYIFCKVKAYYGIDKYVEMIELILLDYIENGEGTSQR